MTQPPRTRRPSARVPERPARVPPTSLVPPPVDEHLAVHAEQMLDALERLNQQLSKTRRTLDGMIEQLGPTTGSVASAPTADAPASGPSVHEVRGSHPAPPDALADHIRSREDPDAAGSA